MAISGKILKDREEDGKVTGKGGIAPGPHGAKDTAIGEGHISDSSL